MGMTGFGNSNGYKDYNNDSNLTFKNIFNCTSKQGLIYRGSQNKTFFFSKGVSQNNQSFIQLILIQQQFTLNCQAKILKKWYVDFKNIVFMNKSNALITSQNNQIQIWDIENSYNISKSNQIIFAQPDLLQNGPSRLQLSKMDDLIIASFSENKIFILQKEYEGSWKCIQNLDIDFSNFILNDLGNILIVQTLQNCLMNEGVESYEKQNDGSFKIVGEQGRFDSTVCFLDNNRYVVISKDSDTITINEIIPKTLSITFTTNPIFGQNRDSCITYFKQSKLLLGLGKQFIVQIMKNGQRDVLGQQWINSDFICETEEGFLISYQIIQTQFQNQNIFLQSSEQGILEQITEQNIPVKMNFFKIYVK